MARRKHESSSDSERISSDNVIRINALSKDPAIDIVLDTIKIGKQALVFVNSKKGAEKLAEEIAKKVVISNSGNPENSEYYEHLGQKILSAASRPTTQCERLAGCVKKGIAFHHAGLHSGQKELIEDNFRTGYVKIICCTPTLCLSGETKIWNGIDQTSVSKLKNNNRVMVLSGNKLVPIQISDVSRIVNSSNLIMISSVSGYSIKVTSDHRMLVKRAGARITVPAKNVLGSDRIATVGKLAVTPGKCLIKDFLEENTSPVGEQSINQDICYLIGAMLGDGYSGAESKDNMIIYKGSPSLVGKDKEIFKSAASTCSYLGISARYSRNYGGTPQLIMGKNNWFREFLCCCGVEKRDKKHISCKLMSLEDKSVSMLLRGLFDTDGYVEKRGQVGFSNCSILLISQLQKLLLRFGIVSRVRDRPAGTMRISEKEYATLPYKELLIAHKRSIKDFHVKIGFGVARKQRVLEEIVQKLNSNICYFACNTCNYSIYSDIFSGRSKEQNKWGEQKLKIIKVLGQKGELGSRELKNSLGFDPRKNESRLNHHYELIKKKRIGNRKNTEWLWSLNSIGRWVFHNLVSKNKKISEFFLLKNCPLCNQKLKSAMKRGWRDSDFDGDIFWDKIRTVTTIAPENTVYDVVLPDSPVNEHFFVANGFLVHNSAGVDLPAFRAIIRDLRRYSRTGMNYIPVLEYMQMAGRAGRPNFDKYGEAILIAATDNEKHKIVEKFVYGAPEEIFSKLAVEPVLRTYILSLIATEFISTKKQLLEFFSKTFWAHQYRDMNSLSKLVGKMLKLLDELEFIRIGDNDFVNADQMDDAGEKKQGSKELVATPIGKRVAQLYIDPLSAHYMIECLRRAASQNVRPYSYIFMVCRLNEIRPLLNVTAKELDDVEAKLISEQAFLLEDEPSEYEDEYTDYLKAAKTAAFLEDWTNESDEEYLYNEYNVRLGEIHAKLENADWLLYSAEELAKLLRFQPLIKDISKLRFRLRYGVKEELLPLLKLKGIGRVRARKMYNNKIRDIAEVKAADISGLAMLIGRAIAIDIKKQVGEVVLESSISSLPGSSSSPRLKSLSGESARAKARNKKSGQSTLRDY